MDKAAIDDMLRFLPGAATGGMVIVIVLQVAGHLSGWLGALDITTLFVIGVAARMRLRSSNPRETRRR